MLWFRLTPPGVSARIESTDRADEHAEQLIHAISIDQQRALLALDRELELYRLTQRPRGSHPGD